MKPRKKMGRPPKAPADKFSERVTVRLTPAEFARLRAEAESHGLPLAEVLLRAWQQKGE